MAEIANLSVTSFGILCLTLGTIGAAEAHQIHYGESRSLGDGSVRSFVVIDDRGNPEDIGIALTQEALDLPTGDSASDIVTQLSLPSEAATTAFNHIELTYRPHAVPGNPPAFGVPRFGIDFFLLSPQERTSICPNPDLSGTVPNCVGSELAEVLQTPEPGTLPEGLLPTNVAEPGHGTRYFDPDLAFPILMGQPFTSLYDYGFFDGEVSFMDLAVTKTFLETQPNVTNQIKLPVSYSRSAYYPTTYSITYDDSNQEYRIAYSGLTFRSANTTSVPEFSSIWSLFVLGSWIVVSQLKLKQKNSN